MSEVNNIDALPLVVQLEIPNNKVPIQKGYKDNINIDNNTIKLDREGYLSPKHVDKLKDIHLKINKKEVARYLTQQSYSIQIRSTIVKGNKSK